MMWWWHMKTWYSLHAGGYLQQTSRAAVRQTLNMFIRGSEQICRTMIEVSFSYNICIKVINEQSEAYSYTLTQFIQQQNRLETHFWLNTAQWKKMKRYLRVFCRSCSAAAGAVGRNTKRGLLQNLPAVEAAGRATGLPPTVNIDVGLQKTLPFTRWKRLTLLTFCRCAEGSTEPLRGSSW